ncbi:hypothetical protein Poli38472_000435 [Pythium oligandrum]|uniref:Transcription factor CBF/NF-Y/archaeal histone domain-containing protein n=1 Tax=Pythium oligandrum TaxID=41045 RepID=A0A8K1CCB8_PYTOL|nr:hypothetical protein Poli38472_000435 [Pythium oligandrum]|eukprot:TMW60393.1 hypothetical protein Poli38472_000435 [Pythium oligandrum]
MALPRVSIEKLLRDVLPEHFMLQKETTDWVNECASEFLRVLGDKANETAEASAKSEQYRISAEHVAQALMELDQEKYLEQIRAGESSRQAVTASKRQRAATRKAALKQASHEDLLAEQNALFHQASQKAAKEGW